MFVLQGLLLPVLSLVPLWCYGMDGVSQVALLAALVGYALLLLHRPLPRKWWLLLLAAVLSCLITLTQYRGSGVVASFFVVLFGCLCFNNRYVDSRTFGWAHGIMCVGLAVFLATCDTSILYSAHLYTLMGGGIKCEPLWHFGCGLLFARGCMVEGCWGAERKVDKMAVDSGAGGMVWGYGVGKWVSFCPADVSVLGHDNGAEEAPLFAIGASKDCGTDAWHRTVGNGVVRGLVWSD